MQDEPGRAQRCDWLLWLRTFALPALLIAAAKLWLIQSEDIAGSATGHDALWFVNSARRWYWGAEYSWTAFVRPPAYPLWLAITHAAGIPQRLAIELLQLCGFFALVCALRAAGFARLVCLAGFAAAAFHPAGFQLNSYTMADPFYAAVLPFVLAGMLFTMLHARIAVAAGTGFALAVLWFTREESILVASLMVPFGALWVLRERAASLLDGAGIRRIAAAGAVMLIVFGGCVAATYAANHATFLAFSKSDMSSPSFQRAVTALLRIKPQTTIRYAPVPAETFEQAFNLSPAFARLAADLRGDVGNAWRIASSNHSRTQGEIATDLLPWAIRHAAQVQGLYATPAEATQYYDAVGRELSDACRTGQVECRSAFGGSVGVNFLPHAHHLPHSVARMLGIFLLRYEPIPVRDDDILSPEERALYDEITLRRRPAEGGDAAENGLAASIKRAIGSGYRFFFGVLGVLGVCAIGVLAARKGFRLTARIAALGLLLFAIASRVGLLAVVDATSWPVAYDRFVYPVLPLASVFLLTLSAHAFDLIPRRSSATAEATKLTV